MQHRGDVQGLRAVAIFGVLLFHFYPEVFPNGFLGVDIFFVISGYLIVMILARTVEKTGGVTASLVCHFYYRRVKRILPLHLLYCVVAILVFSVFASPTIISQSRMSAIYALTFTTNVRSLFEKNDYFEHILDENLFTHIWSLSLEMQFYVIVPFFFVLRSAARLDTALLLLPTVSILSLVFYLLTPPLIGFNIPLARLWQFFAVSLFEKKLREASTATGSESERARLLEAEQEGRKAQMHSSRKSLAAAVSQIAYLLARWLSSQPLAFIGDVSYSLYLIHWPFSVYLVRDYAALSAARLSTIPLSIALTIIVYYIYERHYQEAIKTNLYSFSNMKDNILIKECTYKYWRNLTEETPAHIYHVTKPFGICEMPPGTGKLRFAVIGNSYAPNQADLLWKHFKPYFSTFTLYSQCECEVLSYTRSHLCKHFANYTDVLDDLNPDVTFISQRYFRPKERPPPPGKPDLALEEMLEHLRDLQNKSPLFFIMDTFPAFDDYQMRKMIDFIRAGKSEDYINNITTHPFEDDYGRPRTKKLMETCDNCIPYDVEPALLDQSGHFAAYDGTTHLAVFDPFSHLVPNVRQRVEPIYEQLARTYDSKLRELEKRLY